MKNLLRFAVLTFASYSMTSSAVVLTEIGGGGTIADNNASGLARQVTFGSEISVIEDVRIRLDISGGFDGDLYAYLTHDGQTAILLNRIGTTGSGTFGSSQSGMSIWLDVGSPNVHTAGLLESGSSYGADGRFADPNDLNAIQSASATQGLNLFNGGSAAGQWTLFIADVDGGGGNPVLNDWELEITGVPEPTNVALGIFGGLFLAVQGVRLWKKQKQATS